jgi:hypothetical protein
MTVLTKGHDLENGYVSKMEIERGHIICAKLRKLLRRRYGAKQFFHLTSRQRGTFDLMEYPFQLQHGRFILVKMHRLPALGEEELHQV